MIVGRGLENLGRARRDQFKVSGIIAGEAYGTRLEQSVHKPE